MIGISDLPPDTIVKIFEKLEDMKQVARMGSGEARLSLYQLTAFVKSPVSSQVRSLSLYIYIYIYGLSLFSSFLVQISSAFTLFRIEYLSLFSCIIEPSVLVDLNNPSTLPILKHLILNYVHNLSSNPGSFTSILKRRDLLSIELRHCYRVINQDLMKIPNYLTNLRVLNLSEINMLDDSVVQCLVNLKCVSDNGICSLINNESVLQMLSNQFLFLSISE
uniref:F-box/LRR-repeat protein n=1 Tax=Heterorhabditis bacteriophora TaxID=37862 RepID=A0A1I7WPB7_HETBA